MSNRRRDEQKAKESHARSAWEGVRDHVARMEQAHALLERVYGEMLRDRARIDEVLASDIEEFFSPGGPDSQG
jgi:hypothetical protein